MTVLYRFLSGTSHEVFTTSNIPPSAIIPETGWIDVTDAQYWLIQSESVTWMDGQWQPSDWMDLRINPATFPMRRPTMVRLTYTGTAADQLYLDYVGMNDTEFNYIDTLENDYAPQSEYTFDWSNSDSFYGLFFYSNDTSDFIVQKIEMFFSDEPLAHPNIYDVVLNNDYTYGSSSLDGNPKREGWSLSLTNMRPYHNAYGIDYININGAPFLGTFPDWLNNPTLMTTDVSLQLTDNIQSNYIVDVVWKDMNPFVCQSNGGSVYDNGALDLNFSQSVDLSTFIIGTSIIITRSGTPISNFTISPVDGFPKAIRINPPAGGWAAASIVITLTTACKALSGDILYSVNPSDGYFYPTNEVIGFNVLA